VANYFTSKSTHFIIFTKIFLMTEGILIPGTISDKKEKYALLIPQIVALAEGETDLVANLANITAALKQGMNFFWVGVYLVKGEKEELVLGPFQGPVACTRIAFGKGVCGAAWKRKEVVIVENVEEFPGHIACNVLSKSEIVLPIFKDGKVMGVLDVDSDKLSDFDETDAHYLKQVTALIEKLAG
jgi:L-methionine (R)-S-oxide reductase